MKYLVALLITLFALNIAPARAQRVDQLPGMSNGIAQGQDRIAAVVNDNVITSADIEDRMKLALLSSGFPDTLEVRQHLLPQILRSLIDEQLEMQEAKRLDITVSKEDIEHAMQRIAEENHIPGDMRTFLKEKGGSPTALEQQIRAGISWNKVIQRELRPHVEVGDDEIEAAITRIRNNAGKQEFLVSEIFLAVDSAKDEDQVKQVADNLIKQVKDGANFSAVARQFSQSTGAASGGDIGWIQDGQLPTELNRSLLAMQPGQIAGPIRSASGYHILALREKRTISLDATEPKDIKVDLQQAFHPLDAHNNRDAVLHEAQQLLATATDCNSLQAAKGKFPAWHMQATNGMNLGQAPGWLVDKVRDLPVGKGSDPISTDKGILVVFVCGRHAPDSKIDREAIAGAIGSEKLELQSRRLQRDLRRAAYLDVRMGKS